MMDFAIPANQAKQPFPAQIKLRLSLLGSLPAVRFKPTNSESVKNFPEPITVDSQFTSFQATENFAPPQTQVQPQKSLGYQIWHGFLNLVIILTIVMIFTWFGPSVMYDISQGWERAVAPAKAPATSQIAQNISNQPGLPSYLQKFNAWVGGLTVTPIAGQSATEPQSVSPIVATPTPIKFQPAYDQTLPEGNWIVIPRIGVRSELQKNPDFEVALERGLWQVPDFGEPGSTELPMIVAGHRYGWDWWWKSDYWKYNSFYLLPSLQIGDRVEVISGQRKWLYEIYGAEEGTEITDYDGDLILYTCKYLQSPVRFFRYARLIDPTLNSQK